MTEAGDSRKSGPLAPYPLEEGVCYLVKGKSVDATYRLVQYRAEIGMPTLCVSRVHPDRLRARYGLGDATLWWISESPGEGNFDPTAIGTLSAAIGRFIDEHPDGSLVLLDGVEYIGVHIGFARTILFVEHLNEYVMPRRVTMLVPVDPECFEPTEFARLDRFTGGIDEAELQEALDAFEVNRNLSEA